MALFQVLARISATGALALAVLTPLAVADERGRGDRGGFHDRGDRGERGHRGRGHRGGDWDRGHRRDRDHDWKRGRHHDRDWKRGRHHDRDWRRGRHHKRDWHRGSRHKRHWNRGYHHKRGWKRTRYNHHNRYYRPPRIINRYYYNRPAYGYRARPRVSFHYTSGYYHGGYRIGSHYTYRPNTIIITDYSRYGLYRPPHGHHWVRDPYSDDAVLASVATGAIIGLAVGILSD